MTAEKNAAVFELTPGTEDGETVIVSVTLKAMIVGFRANTAIGYRPDGHDAISLYRDTGVYSTCVVRSPIPEVAADKTVIVSLEDMLDAVENEIAKLNAFVAAWEERDTESRAEIEKLKTQVAAQQSMLHSRAPKA